MAHPASSAYRRLAARLNRFPQGAPPTDLLFRILSVLMSEREADLDQKLLSELAPVYKEMIVIVFTEE